MLEFNTMRFGTDGFEPEHELQLAARLGGENVPLLCRKFQLSNPAIAFNYQGETYYIYLTDTEDELASDIRVRIGGTTYALAKDFTDLRTAADYLDSHLNFDESLTKDECGKTWTVHGSPTLSTSIKKIGDSSLYLSTGNYISRDVIPTLGGKDFTFAFWFNCPQFYSFSHIIMWTASDSSARIKFHGTSCVFDYSTNTHYSFTAAVNTWYHLAIVYRQSAQTLKIFLNGQLQHTVSTTLFASATAGRALQIGHETDTMDAYIDDFRFYDGIARWSENFTPPTTADYS